MHKARGIVPLSYRLGGMVNDTLKISKVIKWLVEDLKFIHPDININVFFFVLMRLFAERVGRQ